MWSLRYVGKALGDGCATYVGLSSLGFLGEPSPLARFDAVRRGPRYCQGMSRSWNILKPRYKQRSRSSHRRLSARGRASRNRWKPMRCSRRLGRTSLLRKGRNGSGNGRSPRLHSRRYVQSYVGLFPILSSNTTPELRLYTPSVTQNAAAPPLILRESVLRACLGVRYSPVRPSIADPHLNGTNRVARGTEASRARRSSATVVFSFRAGH